MRRVVMRLPPPDVERLDKLTEKATTVKGRKVSRATIVRALLTRALQLAESDPAFAATLGAALIKRGRKPSAAREP